MKRVEPMNERRTIGRIGGLGLPLALLAGGWMERGAAGENRPDSVSFFQILTFGPEINITLLVMLFIAVSLVIYSLLTTRRRKVMPLDLIRRVQDLVSSGSIEQAISAVQAKDSLFSRAVLPGLKLHSHSHDRITAAMEAAGRRALGGFRQKINYISNLATLSPMLGLLGTVLGLTKAFNVMGGEDPLGTRSTMMTASIGEAMGTTVVGLLVGIPAMAAYYLCLSRLGRLGDDLEAVTEEIAVALAEQNILRDRQAARVEAEGLGSEGGAVAEAGRTTSEPAPSEGAREASESSRFRPVFNAETTGAGEE